MGSQIKAICFILLLAGSSAVRIESQSNAAELSRILTNSSTPEDTWHEENEACTWAWTQRSCAGDGCEFRRLPLDFGRSQSCRLSDDHMLETDARRYFLLQSQLLAAKSQKFADRCPSVRFWHVRSLKRCERRAMHMVRAMEFISKAQTSSMLNDLTEEERGQQASLFDDSLHNIASVLGEDGELLLQLMATMEGDSSTLSDPEQTLNSIVAVVVMLVRGSEEEKEQARTAIRDMRAAATDGTEVSEQDRADAEAQAQNLGRFLDTDVSQTRRLLDETNDLESDSGTPMSEDDVAAALLELGISEHDEEWEFDEDEEESDRSGSLENLPGPLEGRGSTLIVAAVVLLFVILLWGHIAAALAFGFWVLFLSLFVALVGCGLASLFPRDSGVHCLSLGGAGSMVNCEATCVRRALQLPFSMIRR